MYMFSYIDPKFSYDGRATSMWKRLWLILDLMFTDDNNTSPNKALDNSQFA